jgi:hypothetical protein
MKDYLKTLKERKNESKVYSKHQFVGLELAEILGDEKHKSLYIRLAKTHDTDKLMTLAKSIADRKNVKNKGAYFMKMLHEKDTDNTK